MTVREEDAGVTMNRRALPGHGSPPRAGRTAAGPVLAVVLALVLAGCGGEDASPGTHAEPPSQLVIGINDRPMGLDPAAAADAYASAILVNVYDTLYRFRFLARPVELAPNLAAAMPEVSADGLRYRIPLKAGVFFVDDPAFPGGRGREVVAEDVEYSIKRHFFPGTLSRGGWLWQPHLAGLKQWMESGADPDRDFPGVRAVDRHTVEFLLREPYPQFVYSLAHSFSSVVAREAVEHYGEEIAVNPVGSGPFLLRSIDPARAVLERNPRFREERIDLAAEGFEPELHARYGLGAIDGRRLPLAGRIVIETLADSEILWQSYLKGDEVDLTSVPGSVRAEIARNRMNESLARQLAGHHVSVSPALSIVYMVFNMEDPDFGNVGTPEQRAARRALRCAVRESYDWQERIRATFGELGTVFEGVLHPLLPEYDARASHASVRQDQAAARRLLAAHGWSAETLPPITFSIPASTETRQIFEQWRAMLLDIGYPAERIRMRGFPSFGAFSQAMARRELQFMHLSWGLDYPDAENVLQLFYGPNASPGPNTANYANPEFDRLFGAWRHAEAGPERTEVFRTLNRMIIDDCVLVGSAAPMGVKAWQPHVLAYSDNSVVGGYAWRFFGVRRE